MINKKFFSTAGIVESSASTSGFTYTPPTGFVGVGGTFSSISGEYNNFTRSNNDLRADHTGSSYYDYQYNTENLESGSGKYYCEFTLGGGGNDYFVGVIIEGYTMNYAYYKGITYRSSTGGVNIGYEFFGAATIATASSGDIVSVYYDNSTRKVGFYINGSDQGFINQAIDSTGGSNRVVFAVFGNDGQSNVVHYDAVFE